MLGNRCPNRNSSSIIFTCLIVMSLSILSSSQPLLMTEDVGHLIFQQHQNFLIYVYDEPTPQVLETFNSYCNQRTNCTVLNSTVEEYSSVRKFIGKRGKEFFLILNVPFEKKYVLDIDTKNFTADDLAIFEKKYQQQTLEPFQASESIPKQNSEICTELVGRTFDDFLNQPDVLKVVYTYTKHEACGVCMQLLKDFIKLAEKMNRKNIVTFGYVDVYLNDVTKIPEPIVPHFYIYQGHQIVKEIQEANFKELPKVISREINRIMIDINGNKDEDSSSSSDRSTQL